METFDFLGLEGFDRARVEQMLASRINSVWDRFKLEARFPAHDAWSDELRARFERLASATMNFGITERKHKEVRLPRTAAGCGGEMTMAQAMRSSCSA